MPTYEKASDTELKIISTTEEVISLATLKLKKSQIENNLAIIQNTYDKDTEDYANQLSEVNILIAEAEKLSIVENINK